MSVGNRVYIADKTTLDSVLDTVNKTGNIIGRTNRIPFETEKIYDYTSASAIVSNGSEIHILGGPTTDSTVGFTRTHYKYSNGVWSEVSTLPYQFAAGSAIFYRGGLHILGGNITTSNRSSHYRWDGMTWTQLSNIPFSFYNGNVVVYNNELHVFGGSGASTRHDSYSLTTSTWTSRVSTIPVQSVSGSYCVYGNKIHMLGSSSSSALNKSHYTYDGTSWSLVAELPIRGDIGYSVVYGGKIHLLSKDSTTSYLSHYTYDGTSWRQIENNLVPKSTALAAVIYKDDIHLISDSSSYYEDIHFRYDTQWRNYTGYTKIYYLTAGTKIYCNPTKTLITPSTNITVTSYGYQVNRTGNITVSHTDKFGECYTIV